ncbi:MAG: Crp/Fnr family transcriptional regulator [Helicobacteraceae bacterium]
MEITPAQKKLLEIKEKIPFFKDFSAQEILAITANAVLKEGLKRGELIFSQGDASKEIYYIISGSVDIDVKKAEQNEIEWINLASIGADGIVGEMSFITGEPRAARALVKEDGTSYVSFNIIDARGSEQAVLSSKIYQYFARELAVKLKNTSARYSKAVPQEVIPFTELARELSGLGDGKEKGIITIEGAKLESINGLLDGIGSDEEKKEIIKSAIIDAFGLKEKDVIVMAKNKIVVRIFNDELARAIQAQPMPRPAQDLTQQAPSPSPAIAQKTKEEEFIEGLTQDVNSFLKKTLKETNDEKIKEKIQSIALEILEDSEYRQILNFKYLSSYDKFSLINFIRPMTARIWMFIRNYVIGDLKKGQAYYDALTQSKQNQSTVLRFTKKMLVAYRSIFAKLVARTYINSVSNLESPSGNDFLESIVSGSSANPSLLVGPDNIPVATKLQQIWMRTQQAKKALEQDTKTLKEDYENYKKQALGFENSIRALYRAKYVTMEDVQDWTHEKIRDIVINDNNEYKEEKRLLQYLPTGEITDFLRNKSEKGVLAARSEIGKEEYARAHRFMEVVHSNNTEKNLDYKLEELYAERDKKERLTNSMRANLDKQMQKGLEEYDPVLGKMFEVIVYNISLTLGH